MTQFASSLSNVLAADWRLLRQGVEVDSYERDDAGEQIPGPHEIAVEVDGIPLTIGEVYLGVSGSVHGRAGVAKLTEADMIRVGYVMAAASQMQRALLQCISHLRMDTVGGHYAHAAALKAIRASDGAIE